MQWYSIEVFESDPVQLAKLLRMGKKGRSRVAIQAKSKQEAADRFFRPRKSSSAPASITTDEMGRKVIVHQMEVDWKETYKHMDEVFGPYDTEEEALRIDD